MRSQQLGQCASAAGFMHRWKLLEVAAGVHSSVWALVYGLCNYLDDNGRILLLVVSVSLSCCRQDLQVSLS